MSKVSLNLKKYGELLNKKTHTQLTKELKSMGYTNSNSKKQELINKIIDITKNNPAYLQKANELVQQS